MMIPFKLKNRIENTITQLHKRIGGLWKRRSVYNKDKLSKLEKEDPMLYKIDEKLETSNEFDKTPQEYLTNPSKNST